MDGVITAAVVHKRSRTVFKKNIKNVFKKHRRALYGVSMLFIIEFKYGRSGYDNGIVKDLIYTAIIRFCRKRARDYRPRRSPVSSGFRPSTAQHKNSPPLNAFNAD